MRVARAAAPTGDPNLYDASGRRGESVVNAWPLRDHDLPGPERREQQQRPRRRARSPRSVARPCPEYVDHVPLTLSQRTWSWAARDRWPPRRSVRKRRDGGHRGRVTSTVTLRHRPTWSSPDTKGPGCSTDRGAARRPLTVDRLGGPPTRRRGRPCSPCATPPSGPRPAPGRRWVRLSRPRRAPHLRPPGADDAGGRAAVPQLGPGRDRGDRRVRRAGPGHGLAELLDAAEAVAERYESVPRTPGTGAASAATGTSSPWRAWGATTSTTSSTTAGTSGLRPGARPSRLTPPPRPHRAGVAHVPDSLRETVAALAAAIGPGARVLEIGSGGGRDAPARGGRAQRAAHRRDTRVRRPDARGGFDADVLDPLTDDLDDPDRPGTPYDAVWASALPAASTAA